jgi:curved DNA-binding protein CbpA
MDSTDFIDLYEILEISPNANSGTLERMFRYLAQRYHPDNPETGDRDRFDLVLEAHKVLKDPAARASYDLQYKQHAGVRTRLAEEASHGSGIEQDIEIQNKLMSILYVKRRQDVKNPGVPEFELERLFDCPIEHLEFHLWYLKAKGWIERTDNGMFAITIQGIDHANSEQRSKSLSRLLTDQSRPD